jgi:hypothetical protein
MPSSTDSSVIIIISVEHATEAHSGAIHNLFNGANYLDTITNADLDFVGCWDLPVLVNRRPD